MGAIRNLAFAFLFLYIFYYFFGIPVNYTFRVRTIKETAHQQSGGLYSESKLRKQLQENYRDYILDSSSFGWLPFSSGGLRGSVSVLYASFTEFLVLYHAEIDTTGSTGRHFMNVSASVLQGQMQYSIESIQKATHLLSGDNYVLRVGQTATVKLSAGTTLLVYGRGFVPVSMGYWLSDTLFVNHDPFLAVATVLVFLKACLFSKGCVLYGFGLILSRVLDYFLMLPELLLDLGNSAYQYVNKLFK